MVHQLSLLLWREQLWLLVPPNHLWKEEGVAEEEGVACQEGRGRDPSLLSQMNCYMLGVCSYMVSCLSIHVITMFIRSQFMCQLVKLERVCGDRPVQK